MSLSVVVSVTQLDAPNLVPIDDLMACMERIGPSLKWCTMRRAERARSAKESLKFLGPSRHPQGGGMDPTISTVIPPVLMAPGF